MFRKHPPGLATLFFTEMWERFSFYIMLALLTLYMEASPEQGGLGFSTHLSSQVYGLYIGLVYFTPFFGGIAADKFWGYSKTIMGGGLFMMAGHLALAGDGLAFFFAGLSFLIIGNGLFKPNISTMLGNLYKGRHDLKDQGYSIFYMGINIGALIAPITATILKGYGWHYAFGCASIGMLLSVVIFYAFRRSVAEGEVVTVKPTQADEEQVAPEVERLRTRALWIIFAVVIFFWMAFKQNGSTLIRWARDYTAPLDAGIDTINFKENASLTKAINPFFIIVLTPLVVFIWGWFKSTGREISTPKKMVLGMILTAVCWGIMVVGGRAGGDDRAAIVPQVRELVKKESELKKERKAEEARGVSAGESETAPKLSQVSAQISALDSRARIPVWWMVAAYFLITLGELCISPIGLSVVSKLAPKRSGGVWMGGWFVATSVGNYLAGFLAMFWDQLLPSQFFLVLVGTSLAAAVLLILSLPRLEAALASLNKPARPPEEDDWRDPAAPSVPSAGIFVRQENITTRDAFKA